jgi:hypothetical protein
MTPFAGHELMTRARRVARLYHELLNAAMKYVTVVVGVARVYYKVLNYLWNSFSFFYSKQFKKVLPEDPAYSTPDGSHFFFFSGRYVRGTMCNSVFFFNFFGSIFPHLRPGHRPQKIFIFFSKKFDISTFWIFFF